MTISELILEYAKHHESVTALEIADVYGMKLATVRQTLSRLATKGRLVRVGYGRYGTNNSKERFPHEVSQKVIDIYHFIKTLLPFADFCVYSGALYGPLQHHISINQALYVETNRDTVESVFDILKDKYGHIYLQPDGNMMRKYVDLREECIIVKPLVTEAPIVIMNGVPCPSLEKVLVDILADSDLEYLRGAEYQHVFNTAVSEYVISESRLRRYARRRGVDAIIQSFKDNMQ